MKNKLKNQKHRLVTALLVLAMAAAVVWWLTGFAKTEPVNPLKAYQNLPKNPVTFQSLSYDKTVVDNTNTMVTPAAAEAPGPQAAAQASQPEQNETNAVQSVPPSAAAKVPAKAGKDASQGPAQTDQTSGQDTGQAAGGAKQTDTAGNKTGAAGAKSKDNGTTGHESADGGAAGTGAGSGTSRDNSGKAAIPSDVDYFTTSIIDGATVSDASYHFTIQHKIKALQVLKEEVAVNDNPATEFTGRILLGQGRNKIKVQVRYQQSDDTQFTVTKSYILYLDDSGIVINTDLANGTTTNPNLSFHAAASYQEQAVAVTVTCNGKRLAAGEQYKVRLKEGANKIIIKAAKTGKKTREESFAIDYQVPEDLYIDTDLCDQTTDQETVNFYARIKNGSKNAKLTVISEGKVQKPGQSGKYKVTLQKGRTTTITLKATDGSSRSQTDEYHVTFERGETPADYEPVITTNITADMQAQSYVYRGSMFKLSVQANSGYDNQPIYEEGLQIYLNGQQISCSNKMGATFFYEMKFAAGVNEITIVAQDKQQYSNRDHPLVYELAVNVPQAGEQTGTITIDMEASTIGLGNLLAPTAVPIYEGETLLDEMLRLLVDQGFSYQLRGNYLVAVGKAGLTEGYHIPEDLQAMIAQDGFSINEENHDADSLGEEDFTRNSGWIFTVNGVPSETAMTGWHLKDGDTVRLRFTLAGGKDVGMSVNNLGKLTTYGKEW